MKQIMRSLVLIAVLAAALCVGALADEPTGPGICDITGTGVTLTPQTADRTAVSAAQGYYAGAVRFDVKATGLTSGAQYLLLVLKGTGAPTAENIVYIDQAAANGSGAVSFNAYPSSLTNAEYSVYLVGEGKAFNASAPAATFSYSQSSASYTLGDVDSDGYWTANDSLYTLQIAVNKGTLRIDGVDTPVDETMRLAADTDKDKYVTANDALLILQKAVGKDVF